MSCTTENEEERAEAEILKDEENLVGNIGGSKVPGEERTNLAGSVTERVKVLKRGRPKKSYDESKNQDSEESEDLSMGDGEKEGKKKTLRKRGRIKKDESNGVGKGKKRAGRKRKEVGLEEGLVKREEDVEMGDNGGDVGERKDLKDFVEENDKLVLAVEEQREKFGYKEEEGSSGYVSKEYSFSSSSETEKAKAGQEKEQTEEDIGVEKEEGKKSEKDNNKVGGLENEEGRISRIRKSSRKAMEKIEKLNMETESTEDEDEGFSRKGRRRGRKKKKSNDGPRFKENRVQPKTVQQEDAEPKQREQGSHDKAMREGEGEGLKVNGERRYPSRGKRQPQTVTKPRVGLKKDENVSRI